VTTKVGFGVSLKELGSGLPVCLNVPGRSSADRLVPARTLSWDPSKTIRKAGNSFCRSSPSPMGLGGSDLTCAQTTGLLRAFFTPSFLARTWC
jgi:hypothetical protein